MLDFCVIRLRAIAFGWYPILSAIFFTFSLVFFATGLYGENERETVDWETPARSATSIDVILVFFFIINYI